MGISAFTLLWWVQAWHHDMMNKSSSMSRTYASSSYTKWYEMKKMRMMMIKKALERSDEETVKMFADKLDMWSERIDEDNKFYDLFVELDMFVESLLEEGFDEETIVDVAIGNDAFSTLVDIVVELDLVDTLSSDGPFTVFAPTNEAFTNSLNALGLTLQDLLDDPDLLKTIVLYHVVEGKVSSKDVSKLTQGTLVQTVQGESIQIDNVGGIAIDESNVIIPDVRASNGVIHAIDSVLLPPSVREALELDTIRGEDDIVTTAIDSGAFPTLVAAVQAAGLVDTLQGDGPFTVFAPTEEAFAQLLEDLDMTADELLADTDLLTSVLTYHVIPGFFTADDVLSLSFPAGVMTVEGSDVVIDQTSEGLFVNNSEVVDTNITASNGIIHVINEVLLP